MALLTPAEPQLPGQGDLNENPPASEKSKAALPEKRLRKRVAWTAFEEAAVAKGFAKYGMMKNPWAQILADSELQDTLSLRSNVDIKDKWRNMQKAGHTGRVPPTGVNIDELSPHSLELRRQREEEVAEAKKKQRREKATISNLRKKTTKLCDNIFIIEKIPEFTNTTQGSLKSAKLADAIDDLIHEKPSVIPFAYTSTEQANSALIEKFQKDLSDNYSEDIR